MNKNAKIGLIKWDDMGEYVQAKADCRIPSHDSNNEHFCINQIG
jgi:hypothetical protein